MIQLMMALCQYVFCSILWDMIPQNSEETLPSDVAPAHQKNSFWKDLFQLFLIIVFIVIPFRVFVAQPFIVSGTSMQPGFQDRDYLIVDQLSYRFSDPERGDVIVFKYPNNTKVFYIKRIIGLPGETVIVQDNRVFVENLEGITPIEITEPYIDSFRPENSRTTLSNDQYYVMGDNRLVSSDSRVWGPLDREFISGQAFLRLFPFNKIEIHPKDFKNYPSSL